MESGLPLKSNDIAERLINNFPDPYHYIVGFSCHQSLDLRRSTLEQTPAFLSVGISKPDAHSLTRRVESPQVPKFYNTSNHHGPHELVEDPSVGENSSVGDGGIDENLDFYLEKTQE